MADDKFVYSEVYTYRTTGEYPPDSDKNYKRSLRRKAGNFRVEDGRLYYIGNQEKKSGKAPPTDVKRMVVETEEEQRRIIKLIHEEAHLGKTLGSIGTCITCHSGIMSVVCPILHVFIGVSDLQASIFV